MDLPQDPRFVEKELEFELLSISQTTVLEEFDKTIAENNQISACLPKNDGTNFCTFLCLKLVSDE